MFSTEIVYRSSWPALVSQPSVGAPSASPAFPGVVSQVGFTRAAPDVSATSLSIASWGSTTVKVSVAGPVSTVHDGDDGLS